MKLTTENIAHGTDPSWATARPRTLDELFDREERLAMQGITQQAELLGGDALDLVNLPLHFRRRPIGTSAVLAGAGMFLVSRILRPKAGPVQRRVRKGSPWLDLARGIAGTALASAFADKTGGLSRLASLRRYAR